MTVKTGSIIALAVPVAWLMLSWGCGTLRDGGDDGKFNDPLSRTGNPPHYTVNGKRYSTLPKATGYDEIGKASWYGKKFHGKKTSNGEIYDMYGFSAAHKTLPLPSYAEITNIANKRKVIVRINDRGPFHGKRIIDLSYAAAKQLAFVDSGTARVRVRALPMRRDDKTLSTFVQVGAFKKQDEAKARKQLVAPNIKNVPIRIRNHDEWYRVQIGPIDARDTNHVIDGVKQAGIKDWFFTTQQ